MHVLPADLPSHTKKDATIADVRDALHESVRLHLASDVKLGVFLSGGVDSSAIANIAARNAQSQILTFTLSFEEKDYDEGPVAREIAKAIGTEHKEVRFTEGDFIESLDQALDSIDQPTFDGLNSYYISRAVREAGIKVALVGSGGDELFGGYQSFRNLPRVQTIASVASWFPKPVGMSLAEIIAALFEYKRNGIGGQARWAKLPDMMADPGNTLWLYQMAYALFVPQFQSRLLRRHVTGDGLPPMRREELQSLISGHSTLAALGILEQSIFLGERLLRDTDVASMAVSLETRLPLVDTNVTDVVSRLPDKIRYEPVGRKQLLRNVGLEGLDPALFARPKRGFLMPFDQWIRRRLGKHMDQLMCDARIAESVGLDAATVFALWNSYRSGRGVYWSRVWAIYVLLRWCDRHGLRLSGDCNSDRMVGSTRTH